MRRLIVAPVALLAVTCARDGVPRQADRAVEVKVAPVPAGSDVAAAPPPSVASPTASPVTVLYRGRVPADIARHRDKSVVTTVLVGIETSRRAAWLRHLVQTRGLEIDELTRVPLSASAPEAPISERFSNDQTEKALLRRADVLASLGFVSKSGGGIAVSHDHILHEDGDHLTLRDRNGKNPRHFSRAAQSAYKPALSPDGGTAAFWGCDGAIAARGKTLPEIQACYALYVAPLKGKPTRIPEAAESSAPVFDVEGRYVYATSTARSKTNPKQLDGGCLLRVDARPPHAREALFCSPSDGAGLGMFLSPDGKTVVIGATEKTPDLGRKYTWLALPDGRALGTTRIALASSFEGTLGASGLFVVPAAGGLAVADPSGKVRVVPGLEHAFVSVAAQWDGDAVYALREEEPDVVEVLLVDARAALLAGRELAP